MKQSWRHPIIGVIIGAICLLLGIEYFTAIKITFFLMIAVEIAQWLGALTFKFYFIPVFHKINIQKYDKAKWLDCFWDVVLGTAGGSMGYFLFYLVF